MALSFNQVLCQIPKVQSTYDILNQMVNSGGMSGLVLSRLKA
jgi:hypothetical protein